MPLRKSFNTSGISSPETFSYRGLKFSPSSMMHNIGSYFLWTLAACTLWDGFLAKNIRSGHIFLLQELNLETQNPGNISDADNEIKAKLDRLDVKIETQLKEVESKLEGNLLEVQTKLEGQQTALTKIENQLQSILNKMQEPQQIDTNTRVNTTNVPGFERIGTRYIQIVEDFADWDTAKRRCRELGGYLASFRNEEELRAVANNLLPWNYWLGINDQDAEGHFVSEASHKPAEFLKWEEGEPNDENHKENCVLLSSGTMRDADCRKELMNFICQADNET